jgi:RHS repeat-associated protein
MIPRLVGQYYPYGSDKGSGNPASGEKFTGYQQDAETGLDYAINRYQQPGSGRFLTPDKAASASASDPGSWNRYAYVAGDPVNATDPSGQVTLTGANGEESDGSCYEYAAMAYLNPPAYVAACGDPSIWLAMPIPPGGGGGGGSNCVGLAFASSGSPDCGGAPSQPVQNPPPPTCDQVLTQSIQTFLQGADAPLLKWDPTLASDIVSAGAAAGIDPRLIASIMTLESGHGTHFNGTNDPFGLGPGNSYGSPQAALGAEGSTLALHIYTFGQTTVSALYSGNGYVTMKGKPWIVFQSPAYCVATTAQGRAACQAAGRTISGFMSSFGGNTAVGLKPGSSNNLGYPCP